MNKRHHITKRIVALMLGVDTRQVERYEMHETDPLPVAIRSKGVANQYDIAAVHQWALRSKLAGMGVGDDGKAYDFTAERARLTHEQADKATLENAQLRGELIPFDEVKAAWLEGTAIWRAHLLGLPTKLAPVLHGKDDQTEVRDILAQGIRESLQGIEKNGIPKEAITRIESAGSDAIKCKTAAKTNGQSMG